MNYKILINITNYSVRIRQINLGMTDLGCIYLKILTGDISAISSVYFDFIYSIRVCVSIILLSDTATRYSRSGRFSFLPSMWRK